MNQRRTKDEPKNSQPPKVLFIKIAVSFTSLIPCLIPPTDDRENSEGTPTQLPITQKCCFLRFDQNLELLNCDTISTFTPYIISSTQKNRTKMRFFLHIRKICCIFATWTCAGGCLYTTSWGRGHIKKAFIDACFGLTKSGKFQSPKQDAVSVLMVCIGLRSCNVYTYQRGRYYLFLD